MRRIRTPYRALAIGCLGASLYAGAAAAAPAVTTEANGLASGLPAGGDETPSSELLQRSQLLGDLGGVRPALTRRGITLDITETSEVFGNLTGGSRRGFEYEGLTKAELTLDTAGAFGWQGGTLYASALQIHGRNFVEDNLGTLQTPSNIAASRATRLWELWFDQKLPGTPLDVRIGQMAADQEFIIDDYSGVFINAMMGFPALPSSDLYGGGPVYPLASPAIRLRARPDRAVTVLLGVFDDNPPGGPFFDDPQLRGGEAAGLRFNFGTGALAIGEVQYHAEQSPVLGLPGTYKLGAWIDTGPFPAWRTLDLPGAAPAFRHGNLSVYTIIDQTVWRPNATSGPSLGLFFRAMGAPADRNLVDFSLDAGIDIRAPLPGRPDDEFAIGYGRAHVGGAAFAAARQRAAAAGTTPTLPGGPDEAIIEVTYNWQAAGWCSLQPDFQYVFNPLGSSATPSGVPQRLGNEAIVGLRTVIAF